MCDQPYKEGSMEIEKKLAGLGLELPTPPKPAAHYIPYVQTGHLLFVGGNTGRLNSEPHTYVGKVGDKVTLEQGYAMARCCALNHLAIIKSALGDLDRFQVLRSRHHSPRVRASHHWRATGPSSSFVAVSGRLRRL